MHGCLIFCCSRKKFHSDVRKVLVQTIFGEISFQLKNDSFDFLVISNSQIAGRISMEKLISGFDFRGKLEIQHLKVIK